MKPDHIVLYKLAKTATESHSIVIYQRKMQSCKFDNAFNVQKYTLCLKKRASFGDLYLQGA